jgi:hypothetical protein
VTIAPIIQQVEVKCEPAKAFALFVEAMGDWWPRGKTVGKGPIAERPLSGRDHRKLTLDFVVNSPANRVLTGSEPQQGFAAGVIDYHALDREIDYAAILPEGLVVIMGEETATPRGAAHFAGKKVRRRFTDLWRNVDGNWQVAVRQATVIKVE